MSALKRELEDLEKEYAHELSNSEALDFAIKAAEIGMRHVSLASAPESASRIREFCASLIKKAEKIKTTPTYIPSAREVLIDFDSIENPPALIARTAPRSLRQLSKREQILLWSSSALNGGKFPPWEASPGHDDFINTTDLFVDDFHFDLSADQKAILDEWKRPVDALTPLVESRGLNGVAVPCMSSNEAIDLVQEAGTDCSIVASMGAAVARANSDFPQIFARSLYPKDYLNERPLLSGSGKYIVRLNFNGCFRKVVIDDRLPSSKSQNLLHVVDCNNPALLWPALLEKAYLKVQGGYDFPGSNSGTDLWVLAGWIPEEIFFNSENFEAEKIWRQLQDGLSEGTLLATLGTGQMSDETAEQLGLVPNHDYAILDCVEKDGYIHLLIKNPWLNGLTWKEYHHLDTESIELQSALQPGMSKLPCKGTFWMKTGPVVQNFETLYLNWNPAIFTYREDVHFTWIMDPKTEEERNKADFAGRSPYGSFVLAPQYVVHNIGKTRTEALLLLSKHFKDKNEPSSNKEEFLSIYAYLSDGKSVLRRKGFLDHNEYSSSPHSLLRIQIEAGEKYTIAVSQQHMEGPRYAFALSVFSHVPVSLYKAPPPYVHTAVATGSWNWDTAGGNFECENHFKNPQFHITVKERTRIALMIESLEPDLNMNVRLLQGRGRRMHEYARKDIILDSADYTNNCAIAESSYQDLEPGSYTAICSTFYPGKRGDFKLYAMADCRITVALLPSDGIDMLCTQLADASLPYTTRRIRAPLLPKREVRLYFTARIKAPRGGQQQSSPMRITLDQGSGPERRFLTTSNDGNFSLGSRGFRTAEVVVWPDMVKKQSLWLSVERMSSNDDPRGQHEVLQIEMWHNIPESLEVGVWREWDP